MDRAAITLEAQVWLWSSNGAAGHFILRNDPFPAWPIIVGPLAVYLSAAFQRCRCRR